MQIITRRHALNAAMVAALTPLLGISSEVMAIAPVGFVPPTHPMRLSRSLIRELGDGASITVSRQWLVQFGTLGRGYRLDGEQEAVTVTAPPNLASFARMEETRTEQSLLPLLLDANGHITGSAAANAGNERIEEAIDQARDTIEEFGPDATPAQFFASLREGANTITQRVPRDLFFPSELNWGTRHAVPMPDGEEGSIEIRFSASLADDGGIFEQATRTVETIIGESRRSSIEKWALKAA